MTNEALCRQLYEALYLTKLDAEKCGFVYGRQSNAVKALAAYEKATAMALHLESITMSDNPDRVAGGAQDYVRPPGLNLIGNKGHNRQALEALAMWAWEGGNADLAVQLIQAAALYAIATEIGRAAPA